MLWTFDWNSSFSCIVKRESWCDSLSSKLMKTMFFFWPKSIFAFAFKSEVFPVPKSDMKMTRFFESSFRMLYWGTVQKNLLRREEISSVFCSVYLSRSPANNFNTLIICLHKSTLMLKLRTKKHTQLPRVYQK